MTGTSGWARPPRSPTLEPGDAAVWRLPATTLRPIETVLASYLGQRPGSVILQRSRAGKPELQGSAFRVSLAHSGEAALVAVAADRQLGVDVERLRLGIESWSLVSHALTHSERARLRALPSSRRSDAFLLMWTRKEALLKAVGVGLAVDPQLIELDDQRVVATPPALGEAHGWTLVDLPLPGHAAALALRGPLSRLLLYDARLAPG